VRPAPAAPGRAGRVTPVAAPAPRRRRLCDDASQVCAQVTSPPLDAIREELVPSLAGAIGPEPNLLADTPEHARKLAIGFPVIDNDELAKIKNIHRTPEAGHGFSAITVSGLYPVRGGHQALEQRLAEKIGRAHV